MSYANVCFETRCISSLEKAFADGELGSPDWNKGTALRNEVYAYQIAFRSDMLIKPLKVRVKSELDKWITVRSVGLVPVEMPFYADHDDNVIRLAPGLYPDPLFPLEEGLTALPGQWRALWITVDLSQGGEAGCHSISLFFETDSGEALGEALFTLKVIAANLPKQELIHTEWFHTDCLATHYGVEVFSEAHWHWIDRYLQTAVKHGINMILTPLFTPPLDTEVGTERPTVQLIEVIRLNADEYEFNFDRLLRWVELCLHRGVEYFEFSHLFTQWGAKFAPKVVATVDGRSERIFGWDTDASGAAYKQFLAQFLPALIQFINKHQLEKRSYFHISDEPNLEHLVAYSSASNIINQYLAGFPIIDALSDYEFYEKGLVQIPIPANDHIDQFLEHKVANLWTYYCCGQYKQVANRFIDMPSARNRIIGIQFYKFKIKGFLHWGYNFWYSQLSRKEINPFRVNDAGHAFPAGEPFMVYPGPDGPIESLRFEVFHEALQDLRALLLLESLIGRERVLHLLESDLEEEITFKHYPKDAEWLLKKRELINNRISEANKS